FVSFSPDGISLGEHLGRAAYYLDTMVARAPAGRIQAGKPLQYGYPGNWKLQIENYVDNYHPSFVHRSAFEARTVLVPGRYTPTRQTWKTSYEERSFGAGHGLVDYHGGRLSWRDCYEDPDYLAALAERHGQERARELADLDWHVAIYPNLLVHVRLNNYRVIRPIAVNQTEIQVYPCALVGAPEHVSESLIAAGSRHASSGGDVQVDDLETFGRIQAGLRSQGIEWLLFKLRGQECLNDEGELVHHGISEMIQRGQWREWRRLMSAA
ncbi:MAG TPA: SRPBCC family protein, partial [Chloroflexota bacterium]|nr:SRPBCC family protein [Chloroflexota bacterium]